MTPYKFVLEHKGAVTHWGIRARDEHVVLFDVNNLSKDTDSHPDLDAALSAYPNARFIWTTPEVAETHRTERQTITTPNPDGATLAEYFGRSVSECLDCGRTGYPALGAYRCEFAAEPALV